MLDKLLRVIGLSKTKKKPKVRKNQVAPEKTKENNKNKTKKNNKIRKKISKKKNYKQNIYEINNKKIRKQLKKIR